MSFNDNYIDNIASRVQAKVEGDNSTSELMRIYALLVKVAKRHGFTVALDDVHDAWAAWRATTRPEHPMLVPMEQVPADVQEYDQPYTNAINEVVQEPQ